MRSIRRMLTAAVALALTASLAQRASAEDIDLFVGAAANTANPNVLVILDNSANWATANQHWAGGYKQGQSELRALRTVAGELSDKVNFGLMMLTPGAGDGDDGGYVRFHLRPMTDANILAFQQMIGTDTGCADGANTLNGSPNCIYKNFQSGEQVGSDKVNYSAALFEAFKYFGGYTSPALAHVVPAVAGTPTEREAFGRLRYAGEIPTTTNAKYDRDAFVGGAAGGKTEYANWNGVACAKNYVILIGNGFPSSEGSEIADILTRVGGSTSQLPMPTFTRTTQTVTDNLGVNTACRRVSECVSDASALFPVGTYDSYSCTGGTGTGCGGTRLKNQTMLGTHDIYTVTATGLSALPGSEARYADEWAQFLYTTDVNDQPGQQNVKVFTIDVYKDQPSDNQTSLLSSMAKYGGGKYYQASSEEQILNALREILIDIQSVNSVFAAASLPINATNRSQNENQVFIGMFRPDPSAKPRWYGNTKRYQIALFGQDAKLADADGRDAVSTETGFIHACSRSFWTTDSGTYWTFSQISAGQCTIATTSVFSDSPDGPLVEKGASAEVVRKGNNPPTTDTTPTNVVNRTIYSCYWPAPGYCDSLAPFNTSNNGVTSPWAEYFNVWIGGLIPWWTDGTGTITNAEHERIINFTRGQDTEDEDADASNADTRPSLHGDVAHSRPLPVNYGGLATCPNGQPNTVVLYYGANDGTFKAVRGCDGKELWSYISPEHHYKLRRLQRNSPLVLYPTMTTPYPTPTPTRKDYFFDGSAGLFQNADNSKIWVYPSMRRGGNMLHSFDVTNPTSPTLKWRKGCWKTPWSDLYVDELTAANLVQTPDGYWCNPGFENIGETWSTPSVALVKGFSTDPNQPVVVVGGGYDTCEDVDSATTTCSAPRGRGVYILNANDGTIVKVFGVDGTGTIERSVASDITLVDRNFDGFADHGYFADTGGAIYRIDFVDPATLVMLAVADWKMTKIAYTTGGARKFLFAPAALASAGRVYLTIGSGDRERPLLTNYPYGTTAATAVVNRAYMLIDRFELPSTDPTVLPVNLDGGSMDNMTLVASTNCTPPQTSGAKGWFFDLPNRGEQTVTSSAIFGGLVFFSTNHAKEPAPGVCNTELGEARGYAVNLLTASGAVGTEALCGGSRSAVFAGGGLPPSPVTGTVPVNGVPITIMIGGVQRTNPGESAPIGAQRVRPAITQRRTRIYWYQHGDQ